MESYEAKERTYSREKLKEIVNNEKIIVSDELQSLIVALGLRNGADIEVFVNSEQELEKFIPLLNELGLNCFVLRDLERTNVEIFGSLFEEEDLESSEFEEKIGRELKARIYITKDSSYEEDFFEKIENNDVYDSSYHRKMGKFYGYPKEDIEAFIYNQAPHWKKFAIRLREGKKDIISVSEALEKYGGSLREEERKAFNSFISHKLADTEGSFKKNLERANSVKTALESEGIETENYLDSL